MVLSIVNAEFKAAGAFFKRGILTHFNDINRLKLKTSPTCNYRRKQNNNTEQPRR